MINLLPPQGKKALMMEYGLRVWSTMATLFGVTFILIAIAHIPTYVLIDAQIKTLENANREDAERDKAIAEAETAVSNITYVIEQLRRGDEALQSTKIIEEIQAHAPSSITFQNFTIPTNETDGSILVRGEADTRVDLAAFRNAIEESAMFMNAEIPIADLARDVDVPFSITLTLSNDV